MVTKNKMVANFNQIFVLTLSFELIYGFVPFLYHKSVKRYGEMLSFVIAMTSVSPLLACFFIITVPLIERQIFRKSERKNRKR